MDPLIFCYVYEPIAKYLSQASKHHPEHPGLKQAAEIPEK